MIRRDVEEEILMALDTYLLSGRRLPGTSDGKVNVAGLCREMGLRASDVQHIFRKETLKTVVNALALEQGLSSIGSRADREAADKLVETMIATTASRARKDAQAATEQAAGSASILKDLSEAKAEISELKLVNAALRERLRLIEEGGIPPYFDVG